MQENKTSYTTVIIVLVIVFLLVALSPFIVLWFPVFRISNPKTVLEFKDGLTQLGEYGEIFGGLGVFISGLGFIGVIYTIQLQIREIKRNQIEINKGYLLNSLTAIMQNYAAIYNTDKEFYDKDYNNAPTNPQEAKTKGMEERQYTVRGKLEHYTKSVEHIIAKIREEGNFDLPPHP